MHPAHPPTHAKKHWGQHFLRDPAVSQAIVSLLGPTDTLSAVVEIGPGQGALTHWLRAHVNVPLHLIEVDPAMVAYLSARYPDLAERIVHEDFTQYPLDKLTQGPMALIGNLPYNVASQILLHAVDHRHQVTTLVCMLQKEVAQRIASPPGNKRYGLLSVWIQAFYTVSYALEVPPEAFTPAPNVTSAVLRMVRHRTALPCDERAFFRIVKTAFQQRRKMLGNALRPLGTSLSCLPPALRTQRAEQLTVQDFIHLTQLLTDAA